MKLNLDHNFAEVVEFHLSKDELEAQTRDIHERLEDTVSHNNFHTANRIGVRGVLPLSTFSLADSKLGAWIMKSAGGYFASADDPNRISSPRQEELLMRDLICTFSGTPSTYIKTDISIDQIARLSPEEMSLVRFRIDDIFSGGFRLLAKELLPMIGHYISVRSYIDETNMTPRCRRSQLALASFLDDVLQKFYDLVSKLETKLNDSKLNLQKLVEQMRSWLPTMQVFCRITGNVRHLSLNSAQLLSMLNDLYQVHEYTMNLELKELLCQMLENVSRGYMKMVQLWTQNGIIYDQQREFFIEDKESSSSKIKIPLVPNQCCSSYWNLRYRLHTDRLPIFLVEQAEIIFLAGKYINILRQCNVPISLMNAPLTYKPNNLAYVEIVRSSYELSSSKILQILLHEHHLVLHLRNVRCFCLLQQTTFANDLLEISQVYLQRKLYRLEVDKFQNLLAKVMQSFNEPFKGQVHIQLKICDVVKQLSSAHHIGGAGGGDTNTNEPAEYYNLHGYEAVALRYEAKWPISLVLNSQRLEQVQILQRILLFLRHVQWQLDLHKVVSSEVSEVKSNSCSDILRQRMLLTMISLEQHMSVDIIQPLWVDLNVTLNRALHIDAVLSAFKRTLDQCMQLCLFSELTYVRAIFTLGRLCLNYCGYLDSPSFDYNSEQFIHKVKDYEKDFDNFMLSILNLVRELAKSGGRSGRTNEKEPESSRQLLLRLESVGKDFGAKSN